MTSTLSRFLGCTILTLVLVLVLGLILALPTAAQRDPWAGTWRGVSTDPQGDTTDVTLTIVPEGGTYQGVITGFAAGTEIRLSSVSATETELAVAGATETDFGPLAFVYRLSRENAVLSGGGRVTLGAQGFDVSLELTRARRTDVIQPQVEQQIGYFAGEWRFEYIGGEFPPLSIGTRSGTVTFRNLPDTPFVEGQVTGEVFGEAYSEVWTIGFDQDTETVLWQERLSDGQQLVSLGNWTSPIGITFLTAPVEADGHVYRLQRRIRVTSDTAFAVTDQFSVDGEPFRRLGDGSYVRTN